MKKTIIVLALFTLILSACDFGGISFPADDSGTQPESVDQGAQAHTDRFLAALEKCGEKNFSGNAISGAFVCGSEGCDGIPPVIYCEECPSDQAEELDFGPEEVFPNEAGGPAIAELWNPETGFCGLVKVNTGETLNWEYSGAWWQAGSQEVLDVRFPHHSAEYLAKEGNTECKEFTSVADLP